MTDRLASADQNQLNSPSSRPSEAGFVHRSVLAAPKGRDTLGGLHPLAKPCIWSSVAYAITSTFASDSLS
jgi:hypothetical protein